MGMPTFSFVSERFDDAPARVWIVLKSLLVDGSYQVFECGERGTRRAIFRPSTYLLGRFAIIATVTLAPTRGAWVSLLSAMDQEPRVTRGADESSYLLQIEIMATLREALDRGAHSDLLITG
ncbi:MAG: hypothetical protein ACR2OE_16280 [Thermomicrobiales bacterium]